MRIDLSSLINIEPMSLVFGNDVYTSTVDVYTAAARVREAYRRMNENPATKDNDEAAVKVMAEAFESAGINVPESIASTVAIHLVAQSIMRAEEEAKKNTLQTLWGPSESPQESPITTPLYSQ